VPGEKKWSRKSPKSRRATLLLNKKAAEPKKQ